MGQFASDAFTAADSTELHAHNAAWTKRSGELDAPIVGNRLIPQYSSGHYCDYYHSGSPASANYSVQLDGYCYANGAGDCGPTGRGETGALTYYLADMSLDGDTSGTVKLFKRVAGSFTQLGSSVNHTYTPTQTTVIKLEMNGSTISVYIDGSGSAAISVTDTAITAAGKAGLWGGFIGDGLQFDNFTADDIGGGAVISPWYYYAMSGIRNV
jgi:hypothetical protein